MTNFIKLTLQSGLNTFVNLSHIVRIVERENNDGCFIDLTNSPDSFMSVKETFADVMRRVRQKSNADQITDIQQ